MCVCVFVCVCVCVCVCTHMRGRIDFRWWGEQLFGWWWGDSLHTLPSRENSVIPETKLGHKTQQTYNRLSYKMYILQICNHTQEQNFTSFSKYSKKST